MPSPQEFEGKRLTVEERGIQWGERAKERMLAKEEPVVAIIRKTPEYNYLRELPSLSGGRRPADVRFDPLSGKIYYTTWREKRTITEDGRRFLKPPKKGQLPEYEVLLPRLRRRTPRYLENLSLKSPVQELLFHHADTIEEAILKVQDILQADIPEQAQEVITHTAKLANRFIEKGLSKKNLKELAQQTGKFLENFGLANPASPGFQKAMERLKKACEPDSRGRINNLISRVRVQSAYVWAVRRLVVGSFVRRKHGENLNVLVYERETTRWALENASRQLESFLGHTAFRHPGKKASQSQGEIMIKVLKNITYSWMSLVRVAPYLAPTRAAAINLVGCREEKKEINRQVLGEELADELFAMTPTTQLLNEGRFPEAYFRIKRSYKVLRLVLKDYAWRSSFLEKERLKNKSKNSCQQNQKGNF